MLQRIVAYSPNDAFLFELSPNDVFDCRRIEEVNGQHSLSITTSKVLDKETRLLMQDETSKWREWVVAGTDAEHAESLAAVGTYFCVWSLQHDLSVTVVSRMPGAQVPVTAAVALEAALSSTERWVVGTVTQTTSGGASMYMRSAWEALGVLTEVWGGEVDADITVDSQGAISRAVSLYSQQGQQTATRRFDFGADIQSIRRTVSDEPMPCRIIPLGKGEETESGGVGRKITIESVNDGKNYLQNDSVASVVRLPKPTSGWEYPTKIIENSDCDTPAKLLAWAQSVLEDETTPKVTYEASVVQLAVAGMDVHGVQLGDAVQVVDRAFSPEGIRISGRVMRIDSSEIDPTDVQLTIGNLSETLAGRFGSLDARLSRVASTVQAMNGGDFSTADYLNRLLERLNADINATGGYTYITEGQGIRTYDRAVSDPLVGSEATAVVEIRGGTIRIANSRTSGGEWDWRSVFTSGHIAADMVTAANLTAGYIGSASGGNYWNLDTGEARFANTATFIDAQGNPITVGNMVSLAQTASSTASSAQSTAQSAAAAAQEAKDMQVGGTNLLIDSNNKTLVKLAADANRHTATNGTNVTRSIVALSASGRPVGGTDYAFQAAFPASNSGKYAYISYYSGKSVKLLDGQEYTVSCWAKATASAKIAFQYGQTSFKASAKTSLTTSWKRYSWTFTFSQAAAGGSGGARVYFIASAGSASATTVQVTGMKLELGEKATDWSLAPEDEKFGVANAEALAKTYTNAITELDRQYTAEQRDALDASFDQAKVFNRLTNDGRARGIVMSNGQLYINGTYIQTDTLNAGIIKTGILMDAQQKNRWNLANGYFYTKNAEMKNTSVSGYLTSGRTNKAQFNNGTVRFFNGSKNALTIDGALQFTDGNFGAHVTFPKYLVFRGADLAVDDRTNGNGMVGATFSVAISIPTYVGGYAKNTTSNANYKVPSTTGGTFDPYHPKWMQLTLSFINGICVHASLI